MSSNSIHRKTILSSDLCKEKETFQSMTLYSDIINRLEQLRDHALFEQFAVDFLCSRGHDAALIPGGSDDGMDVAIFDGEGEPYPGTVTISPDVIGNMTKSLTQYKDKGRPRRKCIVVTSESLTARRIKNLYNRASKLDFTLVQVYGQNEIATYLYTNARWREDLLQLLGYPSAVSKKPPTNRPFADRDLVGREEAVDWLRNTLGHRLLVGESGAGKTSLLYQLAQEEEQNAWFVVRGDIGEIANAIREFDPKVLMLDGVYNDKAFVEEMLNLRHHEEVNGDFDLIVTCWNGDREDYESDLDIPSNSTFVLGRLTQDQMVEVIREAGIPDNVWLINEIVHQAAGLPGFAVTIAGLVLRGEMEKIRSAKVLSATILRFYKQIIDGPVQDILACFALGGHSGMHKDSVSVQLGIPPYELRAMVENLEAGGIVSEVQNRQDHISVRPDALRHALIKDVFLSGVPSLSRSAFNRLVVESPDPKATAMELIRAKARGGKFEKGYLETYIASLESRLWEERQQILSTLSPHQREFLAMPQEVWSKHERIYKVWEEYAGLGKAEAAWVIENFNGKYSLLALPLLHHIPQHAIPKLLTEAIGDDRTLHSHPDHPLRLLQDWTKSIYQSEEEAVRRRSTILKSAKRWLLEGNDPRTGYKAILFAVIPYVEGWKSAPGSGDSGTYPTAFLPNDQLPRLHKFWKEIMASVKDIHVPDWQVFLDTIRDWAYPFHLESPPEDVRQSMISSAREMALDVKEAAANLIGVLYRLRRLMEQSYPDLEIFKDDVIDTLYPARDLESEWKQEVDSWQRATGALADKWKKLQPQEVIRRLISFEPELQQEGPRLTPSLCYRLATQTPDPLLWFDLMLPTTLPSDIVMPFLQEAIRRDTTGWEQKLRSSFETERLRGHAFQIIFTHLHVPDDLKQAAWSIAGQYVGNLQQLLWSDQLAPETMIKLFTHPDKSLVAMLAVQLWQHNKGIIADATRPLWEQAIVKCCEGDYWLREIFKVEAELAIRWFERRFVEGSFDPPYEFRSEFSKVFAEWSLDARRKLLDIVPDGYSYNDLIVAIVGDNSALYELLLQQADRTQSTLLSPLHRSIDSVWTDFAKLAHERGHAPKEIVTHTFIAVGIPDSWVGKYSNVWRRWRDQFEAIRNHKDEIIRHIAEVGYQRSNDQYEAELKKERDEDVYGRN